MRAIFSVLGLLIVVAIIGMLAKKQLTAGVAPPASGEPSAASTPAATPQQQVQQFQQAVQGAMQQPRPADDSE